MVHWLIHFYLLGGNNQLEVQRLDAVEYSGMEIIVCEMMQQNFDTDTNNLI